MPDRTPAETLLAAAEVLTEDSPVFAPGRAWVTAIADEDDGTVWWISICEHHDAPAPEHRRDANGHCGSCMFLFTHDPDVARQVTALINARPTLRALLERAAVTARSHRVKVADPLAVARALLGEA